MAPILATAVGVTPQIIDDPRLQKLIKKLNKLDPQQAYYEKIQSQKSDEVTEPFDIAALIYLIKPHEKWMFEEQVCFLSKILFEYCGNSHC